MKIHIMHFKTQYGEILLGSFNNKLCLCDWRYRAKREAIDNRIKKYFKAEFIELAPETHNSNNVISRTKEQLNEYFSHKRKTFDIPLAMAGTDFQKNVWNTLLKIPYGQTSSYLQLAKQMNNEKAVRAVANSNGANSISIIIPCHRIIGSDGGLVGYAGGLNTKKKLLNLEHDLFN